MSHPILRLNDGFDHTSPELRDEVKALQTELNQEGFALEADGLFGRDTEIVVKRFQREHGPPGRGTSHGDASRRASGAARYHPKGALGGG